MPLYEYECKSCRERTEAIQSFSEPPLTVCPNCGGVLVKLLSSPAVQFKGPGWYVTDYGGNATRMAGERAEKEREKESSGDSSKDKKGGGADAAGGSPGAAPSPAPSKKKKGRGK